ncbi:Sec9p SCDLUD_001531 [Saccharomycodes ludwigii]|uniref:Sec9p n=1 Tax=Saccharomycodes ludwigii TaxID=36035 RepID=UPI001E8A09FB|nr:hypothetical protein SCDLUD_001531 [Saccharomycodes ludwigii]KAH3901755.1 hypothetical protein SCDLUD_001531 [Saccharomycodes ludwigii]
MGLKKFLKLKPPDEDVVSINREKLNELGVAIKNPNKKKREKFAAYGVFARDKGKEKIYAPPGYEQYALKLQQEKDGASTSAEGEDLNSSPLDSNDKSNNNSSSSTTTTNNIENTGGRSGNSASDPYMKAPNKSDFDPYANNNYTNNYNENSGGNSSNPYEKIPTSSNNFNNNNNKPKYDNRGRGAAGYNNFTDFNSGVNSEPVDRYYATGGPSSSLGSGPYDSYENNKMTPQPVNGGGQNGNTYRNNGNPYGVRAARSTNDSNNSSVGRTTGAQPSPGGNPYSNMSTNDTVKNESNTEHNNTSTNTSMGVNPYGTMNTSSDYGAKNTNNGIIGSSNEYGVEDQNKTTSTTTISTSTPTGTTTTTTTTTANPIPNVGSTGYSTYEEDLNAPPLSAIATAQKQSSAQVFDDLNAPPGDGEEQAINYDPSTTVALEQDGEFQSNIGNGGDDLNGSIHDSQQYQSYDPNQNQNQDYGYDYQAGINDTGYKTFEQLQEEERQKQQQQEDEEVDEIKQQIRFTKQSSVASTRNTLKMAQEAEMAGMNTLGMLGHQSEQLNNVENNLMLMNVQNREAEDKVKELKKLNRSILAVHVSNPFTSKRRLREQEDRIKTQRMQDKLEQQQLNNGLYNSSRRIEGAFDENVHSINNASVRERYQRQEALNRSKKYQFENDEEDDEMELEIDRNLDKIGQISGRLRKLALATGQEVDGQQERIKKIEEDTDNLDINIHLNTTRLTNIR